ncbi:hypothetical protein ABIA39_000130 [Nocardia sp. GAS34]|jgi:hypothetical protein|uniref:hypothetical protein n=1 Tax=unclassified Nocardia TaxID=2637762 RepID=UPI003D1F99B7
MEQVSCRTCGSCVLVEKYSMQHTSVQWNAAAVAACPEIAGDDGRMRTCHMLRDSIDDAVAAGVIGVSTREMDVHNRGRVPLPGIR